MPDPNPFDQFDEPTPDPQATVTDTSPDIAPELMTPRFKAADEAVSRNAHQLQVLPFGSPQYNAALAQAKELEAEYNSAKLEALNNAHAGTSGEFIKDGGAYDAQGHYLGLVGSVTAGGDNQPTDRPGQNFFDQFDQDIGHQPPHDWKDELGIGGRNILEGVGGLPDILAGPLNVTTNALTGSHLSTHPFSDLASGGADVLGLPRAETDSEKMAAAIGRGGAGGLATGGAGVIPALTAMGSGMAAGGAGELARQNGVGPLGQTLAAMGAGLVVPGAAAAGGAVHNAVTAERELSPTMQAFDRQNVPAMSADVGGVVPKVLTAGTNSTLGTIPLHAAGENAIAATQAARGRIAGQIGRVGDNMTAGTAAQSGANTWLDTSNAEAARRYDAIPIDDNRPAILDNTRERLAAITQGLTSNKDLSPLWTEHPRLKASLEALTPEETAQSRAADLAKARSDLATAQHNASMQPTNTTLAALADAKDAYAAEVARGQTPLKDGSLSWADTKRLRTIVGQIIGKPGVASEGHTDAALRDLYGALSQDMKNTAKSEGTQASVAFNRANSFWNKRQQTISDVIEPILGKDKNATPEQAFRQIQSWAGNNGSFVRTAQLFKALPEEEANTVRASLFDKLGNVSAGRQNPEGTMFSPSDMLTQWNKMDPRAKRLLFNGDGYQRDIQDILTIAASQKSAGKFANTSRTGLAMHASPGVLISHNPVGLALQYGAGWILGHPQMARWLASSAKKPNVPAQLAHIDRLTAIAAAQPAIRDNVIQFQSRLRDAVQNPQPLAAQTQKADQ